MHSGPVAVSAGRGGGGGGEEEEEEAEAHHCSFQTEVLFVLHSACAHAQVRAGKICVHESTNLTIVRIFHLDVTFCYIWEIF